jgi:CheY-like chemotaxis protein
VEDTFADAQLTDYAMKLGDIPYSMHVVSDGAKALNFLKRIAAYADAPRPDLILLDLELPMLSGNKVLEFIKGDEQLTRSSFSVLKTRQQARSTRTSFTPIPMSSSRWTWLPFTKKVQSIADYWSKHQRDRHDSGD